MSAALAKKHLDPEVNPMPPTENNDLAIQVAELRSDVRHVQSDITDIKGRFEEVNKRFDTIDKRFDAVDKRFERVDQKIDDLKDSLAATRMEIKESIASTKMWALGLYIALAGTLLYVIAHSAKWI